MELKSYQQEVINDLSNFIEQLDLAESKDGFANSFAY